MTEQNKRPEPKVTIHQVKRRKHPNEEKYCGRMSYDYNKALINLSGNLTDEERVRFSSETEILNQERLDQFKNSLLPEDIVGIDIDVYKFKSNSKGGLVCGDTGKSQIDLFLTDKEIDIALAIGYCEILYRDNKPYGVSETVNIKIIDYYSGETKSEENKNESKNEEKSVKEEVKE